MIEITRICDTCHARHAQIIDHGIKTVTYEIAFICTDCILKQARRPEPQHVQDLVRLRHEEAQGRMDEIIDQARDRMMGELAEEERNNIRMEQTLSRLETE